MNLQAVSLLVALALLAPGVSAMNFTDNQVFGFGEGTGVNITNTSAGLTLANETVEAYYMNGTFASRLFDAGQIVRWESAAINITMNASEHIYSILYASSNDSLAWSGWNSLPKMGRYLNYGINISSANNQTRPVIDTVNITYSYIAPDAQPASPAAGYTTNTNSVNLNCSATSVNGLKNISIWWNGTSGGWAANFSNDTAGLFNYTIFTVTGFPAGMYTWACLAYDNQSNPSWGANRTLLYQPVTAGPVISPYNTSAANVLNGSAVSLAMYASSSALSAVWINLSYPNASAIRLFPSNGGYVNFTPPVAGLYNVTFFANDTTGNVSNASASFTAVAPLNVNISVAGMNGTNMSSNVTFYYAGTSNQAAFYSSATGSYGARVVPNASCDMVANAYGGNLTVWLLGVNPALNLNGWLVLDSPNAQGFIRVYAVNSSYSGSGARIRMSYAGINVTNENTLKMQRCADWNFTAGSCSGNWSDVTPVTLDGGADCLQADVAGFSAYGLKQGGYCGDGTCDSGESTSSCPSDCRCNSGDNRSCSVAHTGRCAAGGETCVSGAWTGCPLPAAEACNQLDDDCDGTIDNVNGGGSMEEAQCQCYGGGRPVAEACNGIDDDCDGQTDDGLRRQCGSNLGACLFGTSTCSSGLWSSCDGGVEAVPEVCGDGVDDDCDGVVDNGCASNEPCLLGAINPSGCRCGNATHTGGYCCYGSWQAEPCFRLPWELLIILGVAGAAAGAVVHIARKRNRQASWDELEKKYTPL